MPDQHQRFVRRNRVDERSAIAIALLAGVMALAAPASPTGSTVADGIVVFVAVAFGTWASASAPWWAVAAAGGVAMVVSLQPLVAVAGMLALLIGLHVGLFRSDDSELRAVGAGLALNALLWAELDGFFGLSSIIGIATGALLAFTGVRRRRSATRRKVWVALAVSAGFAVLATVAAAVAGFAARNDLESATRIAREGIWAVEAGEYDRGAQLLADSAAQFRAGADRLSGPLVAPAALVPVVAQNVTAGSDLSEAAAGATQVAADALGSIGLDDIGVIDNTIDLAALSTAEQALSEVRAALLDLGEASDRVESPWLVGPLQDELAELDAEITDIDPTVVNAIDALRIAPELLGQSEPRTYVLLFTTPAEARGMAGFFGNWAELTIDGGRATLTRFGRTGQLNDGVDGAGVRCDECPEEFLAAYGQYGFFMDEGDTVGGAIFSNITLGAHFPYVAETVAALYPDGLSEPDVVVDGVISVDPYVVAQFMEYTGPIEVPELGVTVSSEDAAEFLLVDQYRLAEEKGIRVEALETLGTEAILRLLNGALPDPIVLARDLGPLAAENRLNIWSRDATAQAVFDRVNLTGGLPRYDPSVGGFGMTVINGSANKIDSFLVRDVEVAEGPDGGLVATATLTNTAPTSGYPPYVIGNTVGLPDGTSRLIVQVFGPSFGQVFVDDVMVETGTFLEAGWFGQRVTIDIASGQTVVVRAEYPQQPQVAGAETVESEPTLWEQPLRR